MEGHVLKSIDWENFPLPLIQVNPPSLELTNSILTEVYENGIFSNSGPIQRRASSLLARNVGEDFDGYLACSNTLALVACLLANNVRGRNVIISNFTFAATIHAVILAGGIPVVCDIDRQTLTLDIAKVENLIKREDLDVAVVLPTRVFGFVNDMSEIIEMCARYAIPVVVDAAATFPSDPDSWEFRAKAQYEVFSLHATKVFGIGEGGLIVGSNAAINKVRSPANFGLLPPNSLSFDDGVNAKADEFVSARAIARTMNYAEDVRKRKTFVEVYKTLFKNEKNIRILNDGPETIYSYFPVIFKTESALLKFQSFINEYILTRRYYFPTMRQGYEGNSDVVFDSNLAISELIATTTLCLPVYTECSDRAKLELASLISRGLRQLS